jgi:hypothetical protein
MKFFLKSFPSVLLWTPKVCYLITWPSIKTRSKSGSGSVPVGTYRTRKSDPDKGRQIDPASKRFRSTTVGTIIKSSTVFSKDRSPWYSLTLEPQMSLHFNAKFIKGLNLLIYIIVQLKYELCHPTGEKRLLYIKTFMKNKKTNKTF